MRKLLRSSTCLLFILSSAISYAQSVKSDYDSKTDFSKFKTYAWLAPGDSVLNRYRHDKLYGGTITYFADKELKQRGMAIDSLRPDAVFVFYTSVEEITTYSQSATLSVGVGVAGPGYYVAGAAPVAGGRITTSTVEDGTLKFAMYDTNTRQLVWTAMAEKRFKLTDDVQKILEDYIQKIFNKYPVRKSH